MRPSSGRIRPRGDSGRAFALHIPCRRGPRRAPGALPDLVDEQAALTFEMALRIEKAFGVSMDTLLRMQVWHHGYTMRLREGEIEVKR